MLGRKFLQLKYIDLPQTVIKHLQSQLLANTLCVSVLAGELTSKQGQGVPSVSF